MGGCLDRAVGDIEREKNEDAHGIEGYVSRWLLSF